jgi:hypothetical protein
MTPTTSTLNLVHDDDLKVNAIRDGKLLAVSWQDLTMDEQQAARFNLFFNPYYY